MPFDDALPRYASRTLPAHRYLPGRTPRPPATTEAASRAPAAFDPTAWCTCEAFLHGADLWNRRFFWEAHEAWEEPWRAAGRDSVVGRLLQGLILLAAAAVKHELGAAEPARRLAVRGARQLRSDAREAGARFDAPAFAAAVERWVGGARPAPPLLQLDPPRE